MEIEKTIKVLKELIIQAEKIIVLNKNLMKGNNYIIEQFEDIKTLLNNK